MKNLKFFSLFLCAFEFLCLLSVLPENVRGDNSIKDEIENKKQELEKLKIKSRETEIQLNKVEKEETDLVEKLHQLEEKINELAKEKQSITEEISRINSNLDVISQTLVQLNGNFRQCKLALQNRLVDLYRQPQMVYLKLVLNSSNMTSLINRVKFIKKIIQHDVDLIKKIKKYREDIQEKRWEEEKNRGRLKKLLELKDSKMAELKTSEEEKQILKKKLEHQKAILKKRMEELIESSKNLETLIAELIKKKKMKEALEKRKQENIDQKTEKVLLSWPAGNRSSIVTPFGASVDPVYKTPRFNSGIDIEVSENQGIKAAEEGIVLYKGEMSGYGKFILIDHGNELIAVYAKLKEYMVRINQRVEKGQEIGKAGSEPFHFEVRKGSECVNPLKWLI